MESVTTDEPLMIFKTSLGWMALRSRETTVLQLTFGHPTAAAATQAIGAAGNSAPPRSAWQKQLAQRLKDFADGKPDSFSDLELDCSALTPFQRSVAEHCRAIPYGATVTYGELADRAHAPRAARAVGNCMAANRLPLLIPCHRVVPSGGAPGPYSAPGGPNMKRRLLALEAGFTGTGERLA